jgi:hypothetical protein
VDVASVQSLTDPHPVPNRVLHKVQGSPHSGSPDRPCPAPLRPSLGAGHGVWPTARGDAASVVCGGPGRSRCAEGREGEQCKRGRRPSVLRSGVGGAGRLLAWNGTWQVRGPVVLPCRPGHPEWRRAVELSYPPGIVGCWGNFPLRSGKDWGLLFDLDCRSEFTNVYRTAQQGNGRVGGRVQDEYRPWEASQTLQAKRPYALCPRRSFAATFIGSH